MSDFTFSLASDLVRVGTTEDGDEVIGEAFYVVATDAKGYRWRSSPGLDMDWADSFRFCKYLTLEVLRHSMLCPYHYTPHKTLFIAEISIKHGWDNDGVLAHRGWALAKLAELPVLDREDWSPMFPVYGSDAYVESDQERLDVDAERNDRPYYHQ